MLDMIYTIRIEKNKLFFQKLSPFVVKFKSHEQKLEN